MPPNGQSMCKDCGYDLRGHQRKGVCPECGTPIRDSLELPSFRDVVLRPVFCVILTQLLVFAVLGTLHTVVPLLTSEAVSPPLVPTVVFCGLAAGVLCLAIGAFRFLRGGWAKAAPWIEVGVVLTVINGMLLAPSYFANR